MGGAMNGCSANGWSEEHEKELARLWNDERLSASRIAAVLGRTRSAITGKVDRMRGRGWKMRQAGDGGARKVVRKRAMPTAGQKAGARNPSAIAAGVRQKTEREVAVLAKRRAVADKVSRAIVAADEQVPADAGHDLRTASETSCKWVLGDPKNMRFCDRDHLTGRPYCAEHLRRSIFAEQPAANLERLLAPARRRVA